MLQECFGEKKEDKAMRIFPCYVYATMLGGIFLSVLGAILIPSICSLLGAKGALLSDCVLYARLSLSLCLHYAAECFQSFLSLPEKTVILVFMLSLPPA